MTSGEGHLQGSDQEVKGKKAPTGARARSIKTPLQREALEAAYLSEKPLSTCSNKHSF